MNMDDQDMADESKSNAENAIQEQNKYLKPQKPAEEEVAAEINSKELKQAIDTISVELVEND